MIVYNEYQTLPQQANKEKVINKMNDLKSINQDYLKRIIKLNTEQEIENQIVHEILQEMKAKHRLQFSAVFYFSFYTFGATIISNHYGHSKSARIFLLLFLYLPNVIFYQKKFAASNIKVQEVLLKHSLAKLGLARDKSLMDNFTRDYLNFYNHNKLI